LVIQSAVKVIETTAGGSHPTFVQMLGKEWGEGVYYLITVEAD